MAKYEAHRTKLGFIMQPEISSRCSSCGAAVRDPAMFCPECGKPLATASIKTTPDGAVTQAEVNEPDSHAARPSTSTPAADQTESVPIPTHTSNPAENAAPGARERTREKLQRASHAARGALEDNVKRVEKIHYVSTAMFEEATYDPSLRFVLVALGLFLVFILLLVLSKVMG